MIRPSNSNRQIHRVALLSPYSGGNLGNTAIISAMIANLRKRIADVEIIGITLNPDHTSRRHGIQAFPLAAGSRPYYFQYDSGISVAGRSDAVPRLRRVKRWIKHVWLLSGFLKTVRVFTKELVHLAAAAQVIRKTDRLIITGGGALDEFWGGPWGHPWSLAKWSVLSRLFRVPVLFVSVGKCSLERPLSRLFVCTALRAAAYRSYRDRQSKAAVEAFLHDARTDPVCPDLAFSYPYSVSRAVSDPMSSAGPLVVGFSPIAFCDPRAWPLKDEGRYQSYLTQLAAMLKWLINEDYHVLLFATDSPDHMTIADLHGMIMGSSTKDAVTIIPTSIYEDTDSFLRTISTCDIVIASRLHGVILSHLNAIPVLAISYDPKVDAHMSDVGQKGYCLSINHLQPRALIERFRALSLARQREVTRLHDAAQLFRQRLELQYDQVLGAAQPVTIAGRCESQIDTLTVSAELK